MSRIYSHGEAQEMAMHILSHTQFNEEGGEQYITLSVPFGNSMTDHMKIFINPSMSQLVIDVIIGGKIAFSGITAADMLAPMLPVYKH